MRHANNVILSGRAHALRAPTWIDLCTTCTVALLTVHNAHGRVLAIGELHAGYMLAAIVLFLVLTAIIVL
jgi:hypothetical protein